MFLLYSDFLNVQKCIYDRMKIIIGHCPFVCHLFMIKYIYIYLFIVFNATFSNIPAILWRPILVVEEAGENHRPWANNWSTLSLASRVHLIL
jgi:hypothetical protein